MKVTVTRKKAVGGKLHRRSTRDPRWRNSRGVNHSRKTIRSAHRMARRRA